MNYLAHFHLSDGDDGLLLGALLGDFVKGPLKAAFSPGLEQGIRLHRQVDAFADRHRDLRRLQRQFDPAFQRYGGIMLDVVFDHFLSRHWQHFHPRPLGDFGRDVYRLIGDNPLLPPAAARQAHILARHDVLGSFHRWATVEGALFRVHQRLRRDNPLAQAAVELERHYPLLEQSFLDFYPQLIEHCTEIRRVTAKS